jgi:hypothetical protein
MINTINRKSISISERDAFINDNIGAIESFSSPSIDGTLYFWNITQQITPIYFVITKGICSTKHWRYAPASAGIDLCQLGTPSRESLIVLFLSGKAFF